jgi:hypothetical protein
MPSVTVLRVAHILSLCSFLVTDKSTEKNSFRDLTTNPDSQSPAEQTQAMSEQKDLETGQKGPIRWEFSKTSITYWRCCSAGTKIWKTYFPLWLSKRVREPQELHEPMGEWEALSAPQGSSLRSIYPSPKSSRRKWMAFSRIQRQGPAGFLTGLWSPHGGTSVS